MNNKTWKQKKIEFVKHFYGDKVEAWKDEHDDRRLYVNIYNMIIEALETLPEEPNNYICVAINREIAKDRETMDEIREHFKNR